MSAETIMSSELILSNAVVLALFYVASYKCLQLIILH